MLRLVKDKRQLFYLQNMKSSAQHLLLLITSLLDYHRLEAGKMDLHPVAFNPAELFDDIYTSFLPLAAKKGLKLDYIKSDSTSTNIKSDPFRLRQIIDNLISNALKFTAEGSITLKTYIQQNMLIIRVTDTGCGMSEDMVRAVCDPFTTTRKTRKVGLGVPMARQICEMCEGSFAIESKVGVGTKLRMEMRASHVDCPPMGDLAQTVFALVAASGGGTDFVFVYAFGEGRFEFSTGELRATLGSEVPLDTPEVLMWIRDYLKEGIEEAGQSNDQ